MKNPNGYGSVVKLSGNRRNPFAVRKTTGWNEKGHPIYLTIGYAPTREEGNIMLALYNNDPYDVDAVKVTLKELWKLFQEKKLLKLNKSTRGSLTSAFKHTKKYHDMKYKDLKSFHMQDCIDNCGCGYSTQWAIKNLFGHLDKFALELDVINKSYAQLTTAESIPETTKIPFSEEEIKILWEHEKEEWVDSILLFLYTGFRISELLNIKIEDIDLAQGTIQGGTKTNAGKNRIIPIHPKIFHIIKFRVQSGQVYLFELDGKKLSSYLYYKIWDELMEKFKMDHTPHECRHTFRSRLDSAGANKKCIDMLMGHKSKEVGERVYTHKTLEELKYAIELITG